MQDDLQNNLQGNLQGKSSLQNGAQIDTAQDEQIFSAQLMRFFEDWQQIHNTPTQGEDLAEQLQSFFDGWAQLPTIEEKQPKQIHADDDALAQFFSAFEPALAPIREQRKLGMASNVWKAAGLERGEVRNTEVLRWLLDWRGDHGQGNQILAKFLQIFVGDLVMQAPTQYQCYAGGGPLGDQGNRVDIEIESLDFLLLIEVKIDAIEGKDQLKRYYRDAVIKSKNRQKNRQKNWAVVYLTKNGALTTSEESIKTALLADSESKLIHEALQQDTQKRLIPMQWKQVAKMLTAYANQAEHIHNRGAWLAKQFADHIKTF